MKKSNLLHSEKELADWAKDNGFTNLGKPDFYPVVVITGKVIEKGEVVEKSFFVYAQDFGKPAHEAVVKSFKPKMATVPVANKDKELIAKLDEKKE